MITYPRKGSFFVSIFTAFRSNVVSGMKLHRNTSYSRYSFIPGQHNVKVQRSGNELCISNSAPVKILQLLKLRLLFGFLIPAVTSYRKFWSALKTTTILLIFLDMSSHFLPSSVEEIKTILSNLKA